jgi:hypothetical protein
VALNTINPNLVMESKYVSDFCIICYVIHANATYLFVYFS